MILADGYIDDRKVREFERSPINRLLTALGRWARVCETRRIHREIAFRRDSWHASGWYCSCEICAETRQAYPWMEGVIKGFEALKKRKEEAARTWANSYDLSPEQNARLLRIIRHAFSTSSFLDYYDDPWRPF